MIEISNLNKIYGNGNKKALNNINLTISKGIFGLLGHNGAGKTTLMNILTTLIDSTSGNVVIEGKNLEPKNYSNIKRKLGYLPQEFGVYNSLTVLEALNYFSILQKIPDNIRNKRISEIVERVNLKEHEKKTFKSLSGGMKRRLGLGIALINDPKILIVDEPTSGVDPDERIRIRNLLLELSNDKTIILSTHILEDVAYTSDKLAILKEGNLLYVGNVKGMIEEFKNKIWEITLENREEMVEFNKQYNVLNNYAVSNGIKIIVHSEVKPSEKFFPIEATIENAYMAFNKM